MRSGTGGTRGVGGGRSPSRLWRSAGSPAVFEGLEGRVHLSAFSFTAQEVYLAELVNRARVDPMAEQARVNAQRSGTAEQPFLDLTAGLTAGELARLVPSEPLALNGFLTLAARAHSLDMANRDFFDHINPSGQNPTDRAVAAGYTGSAGENIAAGYESVYASHVEWLLSVGHRKNVLSLHTTFTDTFRYTEFGPGFAFTNIAPFFDYYTQLFGIQGGGTPSRYVLGVVYNDADADNFYSVGEGFGNMVVTLASAAAPATVLQTLTTDATGYYHFQVADGQYVVTFTDPATGRQGQRNVTVSGQNVKADMTGAALVSTDDHANGFEGATVVTLNGSGAGGAEGELSYAADADVFKFVANASGTMQFVAAGNGFSPIIRVYNAVGTLLATGQAVGDTTAATAEYWVHSGRTYYVSITAVDGGVGSYALALQGQAPATDPGPDPNPDPGPDPGPGPGPGPGPTPEPEPDPDPVYVSNPGLPVRGTTMPGGRLFVVTSNLSGHPIVFEQSATGQWVGRDLAGLTGGPGVLGQPVTWTDPITGRTLAAGRSQNGLIVYSHNGNNLWTYRNLTAELAGAELIASDLTVFTSKAGLTTVAGLTAGNKLVFYTQERNGSGELVWTYVNLTDRDLAPQGLSTPAFTGSLISYVTDWNGLNIAGLDGDGNIQSVWWAPGLNAWSVTNLTETTGAPPLVGGLTAYLTPWFGINLAGIDANGKVSVTWWVPGFEGNWVSTNLTDEFDGPALRPGSVASYITSWGGLNIVGVNDAGELIVYWWTPNNAEVFGQDKWVVTSLSTTIVNAPRLTGQINGVSYGDSISIIGTDTDGHVVRYHWAVGGQWLAEDLSLVVVPS